MKNLYLLLLLISSTVFAQDFHKNWDEVIAFENDGKIKSAAAKVSSIYKKAKANKNEAQIIKCFFYNAKFMLTLEEDGQRKIIAQLEKEIDEVSVPSQALLHLIYAKCMNSYYSKNQYKINSRRSLDSLKVNFLTATKSQLQSEIDLHYIKTLEKTTVLKTTPLLKYESIFDFLTLEKFKTQTVYDYLLKENIGYYSTKIQSWEIHAEDYKDDSSRLLGSPEVFVKLDLQAILNEKVKKVLSLFQEQEKNNPTIENQLERVQFCRDYFLIRSEELLFSVYEKMQKKTTELLLLQKIMFNKATLYHQKADKSKHPDFNKKAILVLDSILANNNHSNAFKLSMLRKNEIIAKSLKINLTNFLYSNENTRAFVNFKNVDTMQVSYYIVSQQIISDYEQGKIKKDSLLELLKKQNPFKFAQYILPNKKDYFEYSTEILLPQLEIGNYIACFETTAFDGGEKAKVISKITVSNFVLTSNTKNSREFYQVLHRQSGKPIEGVTLKSDYFEMKTDKNGTASYLRQKATNNFKITLSKASDTLQIHSGYYFFDYKNNTIDDDDSEETEAKVVFYLDRGIYRPGQTVFYKGIAYQQTSNKKSVVPNLVLKILIENASNDVFREFEVTTNEFGSFSGEFVLPKNGLTGDFRIKAEEPDNLEKDPLYDTENDEHPFWDNLNLEFSESDSGLLFNVEEYKRPKFEVQFESVKENFTINQNITVVGSAKSFSGSSVSDAKVKFTVTRLISDYRYSEEEKIMASGELQTDANGNFKIVFTAEPTSEPKSRLPVFTYSITSSVTDINGETHTAATNVKVGYHNLMLSASVPAKLETKGKNNIELNSTNLNGVFAATKGEIKIYFIEGFSSKFKHPQNYPEIAGITDEEFEKLFPFEERKKSDRQEKLGKLVHTGTIDTKTQKIIPLDFISKFEPGYYRVVFSATDTLGNNIETKASFQLNSTGEYSNLSKLFSVEELNDDAKKDGFTQLKITSAIAELHLTISGQYGDERFFEQKVDIKNHQAYIKIPMQQEFTNSVLIGMESVFDNEYFKDSHEVTLKEKETKLMFETLNFRNKIEPGTNETWSFQLKSQNTTAEAEILASMYDSSLDEFDKSYWTNLDFYNRRYNNLDYHKPLGFDSDYYTFGRLNPFLLPMQFNNESTELIWFGFDFNNTKNDYLKEKYKKQIGRKGKKPAAAKIISGVVSEGGLPLPGVTVMIKGTNRGTQSDFDGYFEIEAAFGEELVFSYLGLETQKITLYSDSFNIEMKESQGDNLLNEVVVHSGYKTTMAKKSASGATTIISIESIEERANSGIIQYLQGQVAGLNVSAGSGQPGAESAAIFRGVGSINGNAAPLFIVDGVPVDEDGFRSINQSDLLTISVLKDSAATSIYGNRGGNGVIVITTKKGMRDLGQIKPRTNLKETAFFFPTLKPDADGKLSVSFTTPESLTEWKMRLFAHNKKAVSGYLEKNTVTQKEIMIVPNFPRFFREKDSLLITAKISNMTFLPKSGNALLQLFDASTMQPIDNIALNANNLLDFTVIASGNTTVSWKIIVPEGISGIQYKIVAKSGSFSDGEENILPVLSNSILVTESIPIWVRENSKKVFTLDNLKNNTSKTLRHHKLTLEYTSNPAWLAIQALPYLMEFEHECAEQIFARLYSNTLATEIINSNPKIAELFESWRKNGAPDSKLERNEALKSIVLSETPWFLDSQSESEQKKNLALLFDLDKMRNAQDIIFEKLKKKQKPSGGFPWFDGGNEDPYITRHILSGLGHLKIRKMHSLSDEKIAEISTSGIRYLDNQFSEVQARRMENTKNRLTANSYSELHYLYARSFYLKSNPLSEELKKDTKSFIEVMNTNWLGYSLYEKAMAALVLHRFGEETNAKKILESLKETASNNTEIGMYWIENKSGWYWYQAPIETQAMIIEAFAEISDDRQSVDTMKVWLIKNKQQKNWPTTKATTEAIYALLLNGSDWLSVKDNTVITIGNEKISTKKLNEAENEANTGYLKTVWKSEEITNTMGTISIENKSKVPGYGGIYWQYFEDLDQIKGDSGNQLMATKELYLNKNTTTGKQLSRITSESVLKIGDLVTVKLIITAKEDMEYIHLKDMRGSCFEPVDVLSKYEYESGLGFYRSTKDAATHFFFDRISKGTYVLEYDIRINNSGSFSNGITTIQSMYAPEFSSHTKGMRVKTKP